MDEPQTTPQTPAPAEGEGTSSERVGDALRAAVERTLAATADSATETRQRAQSLVDDVVRRGQVARDQVARRGEEATTRLADAIGELRSADGESLEELRGRIASLEDRLGRLEAQSNPRVEGESRADPPLEQRDSGA